MKNEKQYLDLLRTILEKGVRKEDRTGTGTISIFGYQMRFDLKESYPLLTTKKMFTRGVIEEILWFIRGSTDVKELQERGVQFWNSWQREDGTIGDGYGKQMRNIEYVKEITPKVYEKPDSLERIKYADPLPTLENTDTHTTPFRVGSSMVSVRGEEFTIIEQLKDKTGRACWRVQFKETGYHCIVSYNSLLSSEIPDKYNRTVFGTGYNGEIPSSAPYYNLLINTWRDMIRRCYYEKCSMYKAYGGSGIFVCSRWHNFENFYKDAQKLPGWSLKIEHPSEYSLDKDVLYGSNCYHPEACMWASREEQSFNTSTNKYFTAKSPTGDICTFPSIGNMSVKHGMNLSAIHRCLNGGLHTHHDWSDFRYVEIPEGKILRYRKIDQLKQLIADIKHNPNSRRLIISLWNAHDIDFMALPCCHGNMIQFYVTNGELSCHMYQRSGDAFLGIPVNIASYALFTMMIAQVTGLKVGEFIHSIGDAHLYTNHIEQAKLQLTREPYEMPKMLINPEVKSIFDFKYEDFTVQDYKYHPAIIGEISV